jgi:hypothetical protein
MKKIVLLLFVLAVLAITLSCSKSEASDPQINAEQVSTEEENMEEAALEDSPSAFLELCYATSVNMPENQFGPENVFDNDPNTSWVTMPGAAPGEGLFFSFEKPIDIDAISIKTLPGSSDIQEIAYFQLYINGLETPIHRAVEETIPVNTMVKSIFVRIGGTRILSSEEYPPRDGISYTGSLPVGISKITILVANEDGDEVPLRVLPIGKSSGSIQASSSLDPIEAYNPDFLFDSRSDFGWADGNTEITGAGENLSFIFDQTQRIEKIKIWNGYHRSQTHFDQNERAAAISFGVEGGDAPVYRLADTMEPQVITLDTPLEGRSFAMDILEIYEGVTYKDLVISELRFFNGEEWFVLDSFDRETRKRDLLEWAQNTYAEAFIDKQVYASYYDDGYYTQSFILRSNGSFILWKNGDADDGKVTIMYADGNWQIIDDNTVRIFGRLHRIGRYSQDSYNPYAGVQPNQEPDLDRITIFTDVLQFDSSRISSDRGMFEDFVF